MGSHLTWLGHSTVLVDLDGTRVLTDPVLRRRVAHLVRAKRVPDSAFAHVELVVVSHAHWDHLDVLSLRRVGRDVPVVIPQGAGRLLVRRGLANVIEVAEGSELEVGTINVRATHAEHEARRGPLGVRSPSLGYVLEGSRTVYFAGDTDLFEGMRTLADGLDVALLPIAGWGPRLPRGHLDPERAAEAVWMLQPRIAIPVHWGTFSPIFGRGPADPAGPAVRFAARARELAPDVEVRVLEVGEGCDI